MGCRLVVAPTIAWMGAEWYWVNPESLMDPDDFLIVLGHFLAIRACSSSTALVAPWNGWNGEIALKQLGPCEDHSLLPWEKNSLGLGGCTCAVPSRTVHARQCSWTLHVQFTLQPGQTGHTPTSLPRLQVKLGMRSPAAGSHIPSWDQVQGWTQQGSYLQSRVLSGHGGQGTADRHWPQTGIEDPWPRMEVS